MKQFKNIIIAEDDSDDYLFLEEALEAINPEFMIRNATNGLQVMGYLKSAEKPDIIFLDLNMPIRNGIATLQLIKVIPEFSLIPIIIYSTSRHLEVIDEAYENGATCYIIKPAEKLALIEHLLLMFNLLLSNQARPGKDNFVIGLQDKQEETENS